MRIITTGNTLFHIACQNGNKKIAKLAVKYGGDMNKPNKKVSFLHRLRQFISPGPAPDIAE